MLLDILLRIAAGEAEEGDDEDKRLEPHRLHEIAITYGIQNPKVAVETSPIGMSFGSNYSVAGPAGDQHLSTEAARLLPAYRVMHARALEIMTRHGFQPDTTGCFVIAGDAIQRFGVLTEAIQIEAAIALAQIQRNGLHTSAERLRAAIEANHRELTALVARLRGEYPSLLKFDSSGNLKRTPTRLPSYSATELEFQLVRMAEEIGRQTGTVIEIPRGKKGGISRSQEAWEHLAEHHPFAELWFAFEKAGKQSQLLAALNQPVIHSEYRILVRTGRTSCRNPNMQQIPRGDAFRETIISSPGYLLLALDYRYIELVTLAAICKTRFGFSRLGDVITEGTDPYCFAAAALLNLTLSEFMALRDSDEPRFNQLRQYAKPIVLGVPVGLGPASLVRIACKQYGVILTLAQATDFRRRLIEEIYPELSLYLSDQLTARPLGPRTPWVVDFHGDSALCDAAAVTPTGRVRGNVGYTQQRNSPFQALAADGSKQALARLVLAGYRVVGFVHDEILVELPDQGGYVDRAIVEGVAKIMRDAMQEVTYGIPVSCEYTLSDRWSKRAELIVDGDKLRSWKPNGHSV